MIEKKFDIIIIGNGAIGCSIAIELASEHPDLSIALVGNKARIGSASIAAGMMLNLFAELDPGCLSSPYYRKKFEMGLQAKAAWADWIEKINELSGSDIKINYGTYVLNNTVNTRERDDLTYDYIIKILEEYNTSYEIGASTAVKGYFPREQDRAKEVLYIPSEGSLETAKLFSSYDKILKAFPHITSIEQNATNLAINNKGLKVIEAGEYRLSAEQTVICAGAFSQKLIDQVPTLKDNMPRLFYGCGTAMHVRTNGGMGIKPFDLPDKVIRTTTRGQSCGINIVPYDKFNCYVGASNYNLYYEETCPQVNSSYLLLRDLINEFNKRFAGAFFQNIVGQRPVSADFYPLIGETSTEGLWLVSGTKREGFFLSPFIAQSIVAELTGRDALTPACFTPHRALIYDLTREEGINKAVSQHISFLYHLGFALPKTSFDFIANIRDNYRIEVEKIYDDIGLTEHGIPPGLLSLYRYKHISPMVPEYV